MVVLRSGIHLEFAVSGPGGEQLRVVAGGHGQDGRCLVHHVLLVFLQLTGSGVWECVRG